MRLHLVAFMAVSLLSAVAAAGAKMEASELVNNQGERMGTATMTQGTVGVLVKIEVYGLPPGYHGMHFHAVAGCSNHGAFNDKMA